MPSPTSQPIPAKDIVSVDAMEATWPDLVLQKVSSLKFGVVQIVIHDSHVVQVESTEKHRFDVRRTPEGSAATAGRKKPSSGAGGVVPA
jgi:hypothetical protein